MSRPTVFFCYCADDEPWKDRLAAQLAAPERTGRIALWDDARILAGDDAGQRIAEAIDAARVAVLLVSSDFLASAVLQDEQVPHLLERRREEGLRVVPVIVRPCLWETVDWLSSIEVRPRGVSALSLVEERLVEAEIAALAREILALATAEEIEPGAPLELTALPSRDKLTVEVLQRLATDVPGIALLAPLGFNARLVVERLVEELRDPQRPELAVRLVPDWRSTDEARLYRGLYRGLRRGLPESWSAALKSEPASKDDFADLLEDLLDGPVSAEERTLVVVLEGLHRIGEDHLEDWAWLISQLAGERMKVLAWGGQELYDLCTGYREVRQSSPFQRLVRLELEPLDVDDVAALVGDRAKAALVHRASGGHPALVDEILERGREELDRGDEQGLRDRVLASAQLRTLGHKLEDDEDAREALRRIVGGDRSRHPLDDGEERLHWLGIVTEDGASAWRWTAPGMEEWARWCLGC